MYWLNRIAKRIERAWMNGQHHDRHPFHEENNNVSTTTALVLDQVGAVPISIPLARFHYSHRRVQTSHSLFYVKSRPFPDRSEIWSCVLHQRSSCRLVVARVEAFSVDAYKVGIRLRVPCLLSNCCRTSCCGRHPFEIQAFICVTPGIARSRRD